ncbi:AraC family transcriptional regulator [Trinickia diaoshuihuensis]|jgi:AraC-like DNA-binding protein|uniref:AraC family transcriptional regulator n=1 Tax=Trinickia diaoshuihuensis TaxID=2292265 RepID=UPI000E265EB4|nr:helix-turn-helix transcriptional regulator [Trinickia diaoshuihuensis]
MPILQELSDLDPTRWPDADTIPRPLVTIGADSSVWASLSKEAIASLNRQEIDFHHHEKHQLVLSLRGVLTCEVEQGLWLVPPQSAIWVPGGMRHKIEASGAIECYVSHIDPRAAHALPSICCALAATPLLRELLIRSASLPVLYEESGAAAHLVALVLDEIATAPVGNFHLPIPADARLRKIVDMIMSHPADRGTMRTWARRIGVSERSLARLLDRETGMSFGRWRQQLHLMLAVKWLESGASVQQVAEDLGYESPGNFVTMFRKALGSSPARYMAERRQG